MFQIIIDSIWNFFSNFPPETFNTLLGAFIALGVTIWVQRAERKKWKEQREWEKRIWLFEREDEYINSEMDLYHQLMTNFTELPIHFKRGNTSPNFFNLFLSILPPEHSARLNELEKDTNTDETSKSYMMMIPIFQHYSYLKDKKANLDKELLKLKQDN